MYDIHKVQYENGNISPFRFAKEMLCIPLISVSDVGDYLDNLSNIECPWYRQTHSFGGGRRAYVRFTNVGLTALPGQSVCKDVDPKWWNIHDATGAVVVAWCPGSIVTPAMHDFVDANKEQGLELDDWVDEIWAHVYLENELIHIVGVTKTIRRIAPETSAEETVNTPSMILRPSFGF